MLIYNYKKEFLGIDKSDLEAFGLSNLADLRAQAEDFADLFVKTPGFIHNFKHVHWIDYILVNTGVEPKVIIHIKNKNYVATINIETIYLVDNPSQKAYIVNLLNIKALSSSQYEKISADILERPLPKPATGSTELFTIPSSITHDANAPIEDIGKAAFDPYEPNSKTTNPTIIKDIYEDKLPKADFGFDEDVETEKVKEPTLTPTVENQDIATNKLKTEILNKDEDDDPFANYVFNPKIASEELGLPVDLVEEFIQDFIAQAQSFKKELYESVRTGDINNVKVQSHKLKGVAANLRVENALHALTAINTSNDIGEIKINLDKLYKMIDNLSSKNQIKSADNAQDNLQKEQIKSYGYDDDDFVVSIKGHEPKLKAKEKTVANVPDFAHDIIEVEDSQVPDSIDIPELADDEFLKSAIDSKSTQTSDEDLSILDNIIDTTNILDESSDISSAYDKESTAKDIGIDMDSFNELFEDYLKESKKLLDSIVNSAEDSNLNACKSACAKLKSMNNNMRIHKFDEKLEALINAADVNMVKELANEIKLKLNELSNVKV